MDARALLLRAARLACGVAALTALVQAGNAVAAATCSATSGRDTLPLVELFTSEGCDSCPPADRWLSATFPVAPAVPVATVLAFHVDYWDRLGWKDRFAATAYTDRQYAAMRASGATFVYTPQVLVQGRDAEFGRRNRASELLAQARSRPARATIALEAREGDDGLTAARARVTVADAALRRNAVVWLAYTESGLATDVKAGENRGVRLVHDHVVRALSGPHAVDGNGATDATISRPARAERGRGAALVAVVQDAKSGDVLQTLTLPSCGGD
ncbi:MAG: DUF1223 domain-containing protein [Betaproteobacteria bacterium]